MVSFWLSTWFEVVQYAQGNDEGKEEEYYATPLRVGVQSHS
jgi:hypothetical protein